MSVLTAAESGLVVPVPEAEAAVGPIREAWDRSAAVGVPAHITLLYPFFPPAEIDDGLVARVADALGGHPPFEFELRATARFPGVLYLVPHPAAPFTALTLALAAAFPAFPPYRGVHAEVVPHLTVADRPGAPVDRLEDDVAGSLPIAARAREVHLVACGDDGIWRTWAVVPLRA